MHRHLSLPDSASTADAAPDGRLFAPSAARNAPAIAALLEDIAPQSGRALEIAAGTGQHAARIAPALPGLDWQPTDVDESRLASIDAWAATVAHPIRPARILDATAPGWSAHWPGQSLILVVNLLHLISAPEAGVLIAEAAKALAQDGMLVIYGPFQRGGELTSDGDVQFDAALRAQDPEIGYKDDFDTIDMGIEAGLSLAFVVEMPANNLAIALRKDG